MERIDGTRIAERAQFVERARTVAEPDVAQLRYPAGDVDTEHGEELSGEAARRHPGGCFTGTRPLEHGPHPAEVLDRSRQVGVARPGPIDIVELFELRVFVDHLQRERAAKRDAPPQPRQKRDGVRLDPLPAAAAVASLTAHEFGIDLRHIDR